MTEDNDIIWNPEFNHTCTSQFLFPNLDLLHWQEDSLPSEPPGKTLYDHRKGLMELSEPTKNEEIVFIIPKVLLVLES